MMPKTFYWTVVSGAVMMLWFLVNPVETRVEERVYIAREGRALVGSLIAAHRVDTPIDCAFHCTHESRCKSYNLQKNVSVNRRCELNNETLLTVNITRFVHDPNVVYYEIKNPPDLSTSNAIRAFNFTNLGASGRLGPTSLGNYYQGQPHENQVILLSGIQHWTVPKTGQYRIEAVGATGGYDTASNSKLYRGRGARMVGAFALQKDQTIKILVGQEGGINTRSSSSSGGGGTFVVAGDIPLVVAGGGGGIETALSRHSGFCDASTSTAGRNGYNGLSWAGGTGGHGATTADNGNSGGGGGGFLSNGRSSSNFGGSGTGGEGGKGFVNGGVGGRSLNNNVVGGFGGGGGAYGSGGGAAGGGGYSGGASGDNNGNSCGGGGGSFNSGTSKQNECCVNDQGHGYVSIRQL